MNINEAAKEIGAMIAKKVANMIEPEATVAALWNLWDKYEDREHEVCGDAATLIELLQGQLAESQRRERAAVQWADNLYNYFPVTASSRELRDGYIKWRGPQDEERIRND